MVVNKDFIEKKFEVVSNFIEPNSRVLDVGCNEGNLRNFLKNCDYCGVDIDRALIKKLKKQKIDARLIDLNKDSLKIVNKKFDYIVLLDVLEHVIDPKKVLMDAKKILDSNGHLLVTLPNDYHILNKIRFLFNKALTEDPFNPYGHLHYFSIKDGEKFLTGIGLKIIKRRYLAPEKPRFIPSFIRTVLARIFPQAFSRDVLYFAIYSKK